LVDAVHNYRQLWNSLVISTLYYANEFDRTAADDYD
jgi:hypothetical protein